MSNPFQKPLDEFGAKPNPYAAPGYSGYGTPQAGYYRPHRGAMILTLGIIGLVLSTFGIAACALAPVVGLALSIPAWLMGNIDLKAINRGEMDPLGRGVTTAGMVTGIVGTVIGGVVGVIMLLFMLVVFGFIAFGAASGALK